MTNILTKFSEEPQSWAIRRRIQSLFASSHTLKFQQLRIRQFWRTSEGGPKQGVLCWSDMMEYVSYCCWTRLFFLDTLKVQNMFAVNRWCRDQIPYKVLGPRSKGTYFSFLKAYYVLRHNSSKSIFNSIISDMLFWNFVILIVNIEVVKYLHWQNWGWKTKSQMFRCVKKARISYFISKKNEIIHLGSLQDLKQKFQLWNRC